MEFILTEEMISSEQERNETKAVITMFSLSTF